MKFFTPKRIGCLLLCILFISACIYSMVYLNSNGDNYTEEYKIFKQLEDQTSLNELSKKLKELKLEYEVEDNILKTPKYDEIEFKVHDDGTCKISITYPMMNFKKLDEKNIDEVKIEGILKNGEVVEKISIENDGEYYTKINNNYYIYYSAVASAMLIFNVGFSILCCIYLFCELKLYFDKKRTPTDD